MDDHALRYALANELHARPFPSIKAPGRAVHLAIKQPSLAAVRDRDLDRAHLIDLLDRFGAQHPSPGATHYFGEIGKHRLKWESHTEFVTYTLFSDGVSARPFDPAAFEAFPRDWLDRAPGARVTSMLIRIEEMDMADAGVIDGRVRDWFVAESVAVSKVVDGAAVIAGDFRIDTNGHMRMALFVAPGTGPDRVGRIVQRLTEIETYKSMSMLGLAMARDISVDMNAIETSLSQLVGDMGSDGSSPEATLTALLDIAARLETLSTRSNFRFGATGAYEALIEQRVGALRESRFEGRQTFGEFMMRRFDPAMRTVKSAERRLAQMTVRATRAGDLLRTRVDVERSAQNQRLLESMDRRAHLQLRLQETVEGLSVVAISYYAINLAHYLLEPIGEAIGLDKPVTMALVTPPVILAVWYMVHRIRKSME
ncbi:MAG: DUF3422 domain-containing protein [Rhodobacteraceae bacterium]|nr:DUF3422 domain-containing protein [Paracoccaceae bacterium]